MKNWLTRALVAPVAMAVLAVGFLAPEAKAVGCTWCEIAGTMEGSGIIVPNPDEGGFDLHWEGSFTGLLYLPVAGVSPAAWDFEAHGLLGHELIAPAPGAQAVQQWKGWVDMHFDDPTFDTQYDTRVFVRGTDRWYADGKPDHWTIMATSTDEIALGVFSSPGDELPPVVTDRAPGAHRYFGVFEGYVGPAIG